MMHFRLLKALRFQFFFSPEKHKKKPSSFLWFQNVLEISHHYNILFLSYYAAKFTERKKNGKEGKNGKKKNFEMLLKGQNLCVNSDGLWFSFHQLKNHANKLLPLLLISCTISYIYTVPSLSWSWSVEKNLWIRMPSKSFKQQLTSQTHSRHTT